MSEDVEWGDLVRSASLRPVWKDTLEVSKNPRIVMWWQAWQNIAGGQDVMHVGVTCVTGPDVYGESYDHAQRMLTGVLNMAWRSVGAALALETQPLVLTRMSNGAEAWRGKVIVRANTGAQFDPLMKAIQETKTSVEET